MHEKPLKQVGGGAFGGPYDEEIGQAPQSLAVVPAGVLALLCKVWSFLEG